jgi:hypothetical protein
MPFYPPEMLNLKTKLTEVAASLPHVLVVAAMSETT